MRLDPATDILGLVDIQPTFMPGGELPVADGHAVVPVANRLLARFSHAFATQDWHPAGHTSFASAHPGRQPYDEIDLPYGRQVLWPDHALAGSANADLHRDLDQTRIEVVVRKGFDPALDSYSTFFENDHITATGLDGWLRQRGFRRLFLAGLATDFCVAWSAEDAARLGYEVFVIEDACRGIGLPTGASREIHTGASREIHTRASREIYTRASREIYTRASRTMHTGASRTTMDEARDRLTGLGVGFLTSAELGVQATSAG